MNFQCPICEGVVELPDSTKDKDRVTCPSCSAQLALVKHKKERFLGCAICEEPTFDPAKCDECERRHELKKLFEEGTL